MRGKTNNPDGRPKGRPNRITQQLRERIADFLEQNWSKIEADFLELEPKDRVMLFEKLLQYTTPRLQATELCFEERADSDIILRARARAEAIANEDDFQSSLK